MLDSYAGHVQKTFGFCSYTFRRICILTLTDLFCHEIRIMLILHSVVVQVVRGYFFGRRYRRKKWREGIGVSLFLSQLVSICNALVYFVEISIKTNVCCPYLDNGHAIHLITTCRKMTNDDDDEQKLCLFSTNLICCRRHCLHSAWPP